MLLQFLMTHVLSDAVLCVIIVKFPIQYHNTCYNGFSVLFLISLNPSIMSSYFTMKTSKSSDANHVLHRWYAAIIYASTKYGRHASYILLQPIN